MAARTREEPRHHGRRRQQEARPHRYLLDTRGGQRHDDGSEAVLQGVAKPWSVVGRLHDAAIMGMLKTSRESGCL